MDRARPPSQFRTSYPDGHFYSPMVDPDDIARRAPQIWPPVPPTRGLDWRDADQLRLFATLLPAMLDMRDTMNDGWHFQDNTQFTGLDALAYHAILRWLKPETVVEIGSGYSTLLAFDTRERYLGGQRPAISCIEPFPTTLLRPVIGKIELVVQPIWNIDPAAAEVLGPGDILFVDSSHVSKTASDVNTIFFDFLPRLRSGVYVHIHDIFLPYEYPRHWVIDDERNWNEQYLLQALLTDSVRYEIVFGCAYIGGLHRKILDAAFGPDQLGGGSLWLRVR